MTQAPASIPWPFIQQSRPASSRRHGPTGYGRYKSYKDWLRDEFEFRCFYCLRRERWAYDPRAEFSVEHIVPQATAPQLVAEYDNLLYACVACNSARSDAPLPLDLHAERLDAHIFLNGGGRYVDKSAKGLALIDLLKLNLAPYVDARRRILFAYGRAIGLYAGAQGVDFDMFRYPADLPDLNALRPPAGNTQPTGLATSAHTRAAAGQLPAFY